MTREIMIDEFLNLYVPEYLRASARITLDQMFEARETRASAAVLSEFTRSEEIGEPGR